jgi:O-antigen/teichoic acid export membrane protein
MQHRIWYLLAGVFGLFGVLNMARVIERLITGEEWVPFQSLIAVLALFAAFISFNRGRAAAEKK